MPDTPKQAADKNKVIVKQLFDRLANCHCDEGKSYAALRSLMFDHLTDKAVKLAGGLWVPLSVMAFNDDGKILVKRWWAEKNGLPVD